jgi:hypothetical protein
VEKSPDPRGVVPEGVRGPRTIPQKWAKFAALHANDGGHSCTSSGAAAMMTAVLLKLGVMVRPT